MRISIIITAILAVFLCGSLVAEEIVAPVSCDVLQYKLNRLYFSAGEECLIYPNAPFVITAESDPDALVSGTIEKSWAGISMSYPLDSLAVGALPDDAIAYIEPAALDSTSSIIIGTDIPGLRLFTEDTAGTRLIVRRYDHHGAMDNDLKAGQLDGCLSFDKPAGLPERVAISEYTLPYVATLIPNVGRACNTRGQLTTSLYYRFDHDRAPLYFEGQTIPQMCFRLPPDSSAPESQFTVRPYPLDSERGRRLLENLSRPLSKIRLYAGSSDLNRLAHYFGDILARDRFAVEITDNKRAADLYLEFLPISSTVPSVTVYAVQHQMTIDSAAGSAAAESVKISAGLAELIKSARREEDYYAYLDRMSLSLITDLGVFPLFRPAVYFAADRTLLDVRVGGDGFLDVSHAFKVILPRPPKEAP